jgi:hypothetical protein
VLIKKIILECDFLLSILLLRTSDILAYPAAGTGQRKYGIVFILFLCTQIIIIFIQTRAIIFIIIYCSSSAMASNRGA